MIEGPTLYRLVQPDIDILSDVARFLRLIGHEERAKQVEGVMDRARQNRYTDGPDTPP